MHIQLNITKYELEKSIEYIKSNITELKNKKAKQTRFEVPQELVQILFIDKYKPIIIEQLINMLNMQNITLTYEFVKSGACIPDIESNFSTCIYSSDINGNYGKWWISIVLQ